MQTFVPLEDFQSCARVLDRQRLGKQRVEVLQILKALAGETHGWVNHPATKMWKGYERGLIEYGIIMCAEWQRQGYADTCQASIAAYWNYFLHSKLEPWWMGGPIHASHRSNLLRKNLEHYRLYWPEDPDNMPYYWPTHHVETQGSVNNFMEGVLPQPLGA